MYHKTEQLFKFIGSVAKRPMAALLPSGSPPHIITKMDDQAIYYRGEWTHRAVVCIIPATDQWVTMPMHLRNYYVLSDYHALS